MTIYGRPSVCIIAAYARLTMAQWRGTEREGRRHVRVPDEGCRMVASCISAMCRVVTTQNGNVNGGTTMQWAVNRTIVFIAIFYCNPPPPSFPFSIRSCLALCLFGRMIVCKRSIQDSCIVGQFIFNSWISFVILVIFIISSQVMRLIFDSIIIEYPSLVAKFSIFNLKNLNFVLEIFLLSRWPFSCLKIFHIEFISRFYFFPNFFFG